MRPDILSAYISLFYMIASGINEESLLVSILDDILSEGRGSQKLNIIILATLVGCAIVSAFTVFGLLILQLKRLCVKSKKPEIRPPKIKIVPIENFIQI